MYVNNVRSSSRESATLPDCVIIDLYLATWTMIFTVPCHDFNLFARLFFSLRKEGFLLLRLPLGHFIPFRCVLGVDPEKTRRSKRWGIGRGRWRVRGKTKPNKTSSFTTGPVSFIIQDTSQSSQVRSVVFVINSHLLSSGGTSVKLCANGNFRGCGGGGGQQT